MKSYLIDRQAVIDVAKEMKPSDMFEVMGEPFKTVWDANDWPDWRLGQRFMNSLNEEQYKALSDTPYDTFYVNEFYSVALAVSYLIALELV